MLIVNSLSKKVSTANGQLDILNNISFQVNTGESVAITGASGSGKSTLLALLAGLDTASEGEIILAGHQLSTLDEEARAHVRQNKIGFVFQSFHLIPALTALDNIILPLELKGERKAKSIALDLIDRVGLSNRRDHLPLQLSGGEQQRVAIARAFAGYPAILFADEPTGNLDQHSGEKIIQLLFEMNQEHGTTLVLVTHDLQLAKACEKHFQLDFGHLTEH